MAPAHHLGSTEELALVVMVWSEPSLVAELAREVLGSMPVDEEEVVD